jgi:hypothetical protein
MHSYYLPCKPLPHGRLVRQDLAQEREQDRDDDGSLGGLSENNEKDGDRKVIAEPHCFQGNANEGREQGVRDGVLNRRGRNGKSKISKARTFFF